MTALLLEGLRRLHVVLASTTVLFAFSLAAYLFVYNVRNAVARAFVLLLGSVTIAYVADLFLATARLPASDGAAARWLDLAWLGIVLSGPAFVWFANVLLESTGERSGARRLVAWAIWGCGILWAALVWTGDGVVTEVLGEPGTLRYGAGPWFLGFAFWHACLIAVGVAGVWRARRMALTPRSRRRTGALLVAAVAPASVFPFLTLAGERLATRDWIFPLINITANAALAVMLLILAWEVAYRGTLTPQRAVRRDLVKYIVQAPLLGAFVLATLQLVPNRVHLRLGLPRDIVIAMFTIVGIVVYQLAVRAIKPLVDRLIFTGEGDDVRWLRRIDERLVSQRDLAQLLENVLAVLCDRLRVDTGGIVVMSGGRLALDASTGDREQTISLLESLDRTLLSTIQEAIEAGGTFARVEGFLVRPLRAREGGATLGVLAIEDPGRPIARDERAAVDSLIDAAQRGLEERLIQQRVVAALRELEPELEGIQRIRGTLEPTGGGVPTLETLEALDQHMIDDPDFPTWVRDALSHYWGGPKLTESPLMRLGVVRAALEEHDHNTARALRSVLDQGIEQLRPEGERSMTASEWLLYNILELKFVRGLKVRDIARRLAVSESDLYRKQRVAIDALAQQIQAMEAGSAPPPTEGRDEG